MSSRSRRKQITQNESMEVDEDSTFCGKHQLLLQYLIKERSVKKIDLIKVHRQLFNDNAEELSATLQMITSKIIPLKMDIKQVKCDITGETFYILIDVNGDYFFPRCSIFNKNQLGFLKQVLIGIVLSDDGVVGKIQALNSCTVLSKTEADETIRKFIKEKILIEYNLGKLCLSPLSIVEFEPFFTSYFGGNLCNCDLCKKLVFVGKNCEGCGQRFHFHCVSTWFDSKRTECPKCEHSWPVDSQTDTD